MRAVWCVFAMLLPQSAWGFDHRTHLGLEAFPECSHCHSAGADADRVRPGADSHSACDNAACHGKDFGPEAFEKTIVCVDCHKQKSRIHVEDNLRPFPSRADRSFESDFDHRKHLTPQVKSRLSSGCLSCHPLGGKQGERPAHETCASCHATSTEHPMSQCDGCHRLAGSAKVARKSTACDVGAKFSHSNHKNDRRKRDVVAVGCDTCHFGLERAGSLGEIVLTRGRDTMIKACAKCHRAGERTREGALMLTTTGQCSKCHDDRCLLGGPAPSWHK